MGERVNEFFFIIYKDKVVSNKEDFDHTDWVRYPAGQIQIQYPGDRISM